MSRLAGALLLAGCFASFSFPAGTSAQDCHDSFESIAGALKAVAEIKAGSTRADVERHFVLDGGLHALEQSTYLYKKCDLIKIDVEFAHDSNRSWMDSTSKDTVVHVSKPCLEYPVAD
jgi:hypothetical protein